MDVKLKVVMAHLCERLISNKNKEFYQKMAKIEFQVVYV